MPRGRWCLVLVLLFAAVLLATFRASITLAAPLPQIAEEEAEEAGDEYVVQPGDWLSKISLAFYGDTGGWQAIVDATNEKAATDPRFTVIDDPDALDVGQLLWIPAPPAADSEAASEDDGEVMTSTEPAASTQAVSISVRFDAPQDGSEVTSPVDVAMRAEGLTVEAAGEIHEGAGHFHILIDTDFVPAGELLPFDENHVHFGRGQVTTTLELAPGEHVLRLQFANGAHIALEGDQYRDTIIVTVVTGTVAAGIGAAATTSPTTPSAMPSATLTATTEISPTSSPTSSEESTLPSVRFAAPQDGSEVSSPVDVAMRAEGLTVEAAGEIHEGAGHFHILLDTDFVPAGELLPFDEHHIHFGQGQLTTTLELEPGEHILRLQFANGAHIALEGEQYRDEITVTVADE